MHRTAPRLGQRGTLVALAALLLLSWSAASAQAADAYRYWSYWWGGPSAAWDFAQTGPADRVVADGDVEGWRYLVSADALPAEQPGAAADFAAICGGTEPVAGEVRVAVVIDYGNPEVTPEGSSYPAGSGVTTSCVTLPEGSTGQQALTATAQVRSEQGATCAINGYPSTGCFEVVAAPTVTETGQDTVPADTGSPRWVWLLAGVVSVLVAGGLLLMLRNRKAPVA